MATLQGSLNFQKGVAGVASAPAEQRCLQKVNFKYRCYCDQTDLGKTCNMYIKPEKGKTERGAQKMIIMDNGIKGLQETIKWTAP